MFKFIKQYAASAEGINIYPIISLMIFFIFFVALLFYVKKMDKMKVKELSRIPLDTDADATDTISSNQLKQASL
jgi:cytochrome c oxidase cbb3-type subunit IV